MDSGQHQTSGQEAWVAIWAVSIPDLSHQDNVRIMSEDSAQPGGEVIPALLLIWVWLISLNSYSTDLQ